MSASHQNKRFLLLLFFLLILILPILNSGCSIISIEEYTTYWKGRKIVEKKGFLSDPNQKEITYNLDNGNWVYVESDKPDCFIHWEVNPQGIIVGYKLEGDCH